MTSATFAHKPDLKSSSETPFRRGNPEAEFVLDHKLRYGSLPELLRGSFHPRQAPRWSSLLSTHGKTTTTSLLAWARAATASIPKLSHRRHPEQFLRREPRFTDSEWFIIEGDEYDTAFFDKRSKFIHYQPEIAIINNLEFDHADIFDNLEAVKNLQPVHPTLRPRNGLLLEQRR